jgi:hypothetical protein
LLFCCFAVYGIKQKKGDKAIVQATTGALTSSRIAGRS